MARRPPRALACGSVQAVRVQSGCTPSTPNSRFAGGEARPAASRHERLDRLLTLRPAGAPGAVQVELFMPGVEILAEGDHVNELMVVLGGLVEVVTPAGADREASVRGGSHFAGVGGDISGLGDPSVSVALSQRRGHRPAAPTHACRPGCTVTSPAPSRGLLPLNIIIIICLRIV